MEAVLSNLIKNLGAISSAYIIQYETVCRKSNKEEFIGTNKGKNKERKKTSSKVVSEKLIL
jgi:hypothetical protein